MLAMETEEVLVISLYFIYRFNLIKYMTIIFKTPLMSTDTNKAMAVLREAFNFDIRPDVNIVDAIKTLYTDFNFIYPEKAHPILNHAKNLIQCGLSFDNGKPGAGKTITALAVCRLLGYNRVRVIIPVDPRGDEATRCLGADEWVRECARFGYGSQSRVDSRSRKKFRGWPKNPFVLVETSLQFKSFDKNAEVIIYDEVFMGGYGLKTVEMMGYSPKTIILNGDDIPSILAKRDSYSGRKSAQYRCLVNRFYDRYHLTGIEAGILESVRVVTPKHDTSPQIIDVKSNPIDDIVNEILQIHNENTNSRHKLIIYTDERRREIFLQNGFVEISSKPQETFESTKTDNMVLFYVCRSAEGNEKSGLIRNCDLADHTGECPRHVFLVYEDGYIDGNTEDQIYARFNRGTTPHYHFYRRHL